MESWTKELERELLYAAGYGRMEEVTRLLEGDVNVNTIDWFGWTPLMKASERGRVGCVQLLLDKGAKINHQDKFGQTPLMKASESGHIECVQLLLERGAQVNHKDKRYERILLKASDGGQVRCVQLLLDRGVEANYQDEDGRIPLMKASEKGHVECVQLLLEKGAHVNHWDKYGQTPLMKASEVGHVECVQLLLEWGAQVNHQDKDEWTPLMMASLWGHVKCVQLLLDRDAEINHQDKDGRTPLMKSLQGEHIECVQLLLERGAQFNHHDKRYERILLKASGGGQVRCVQLLLDRCVEVNYQDKYGRTPLMKASGGGHVECVQLLLDRGVEINHQDENGDTALHMSCRDHEYQFPKEGRMNCVRVLLSHPGIDANIKNNKGHTAMMVAKYKSLGVFKQMLKTCNDFPADSYGKVVLCGNSGAGKSTLTQAIINLSQPMTTRLVKRVLGRQNVIEPLTAGIIPHQVDSPYSNMVVYDLAGHQQYFSSHSACLEAISLSSPAIFLLLQDITKDSEAITRELYYWSTMIAGVCHKCPQKSSVIVVGTHADLLTTEQVARKLCHLKSVAETAISHQKLENVVALNLTNIYKNEMDQFMNLLHETNNDVISMCPSISMMCHMMLAFFKEKLPSDVDAICLCDLIGRLKADQDTLIDPDVSQIVSLLKTLSDRGLIVFIPSEDPFNSWVVLHKEIILKKVNGALFADPGSSLTHLASSTGIVPRAVLEKAFPEYNIDMIMQFMIQFELCQLVDLSQIDTNMSPEKSSSTELGPLLFFPALVNVERPSSATVSNNSFGWSMIVIRSFNQYFTPRFLHVLLHRLPFEFALPTVQATPLHSSLSRRCDVWSRGIKWLSETGVTTIVEMSEMFQSISLSMSSPDRADPAYLELAHTVVAVIKKACQEFCPHVEVLELISCPPEASSDHSDDTKVELSLLKKAHKSIVDVSGRKHVVMKEWMKIEPCLPYLIGVSTSMVPSTSSQLLLEPVGRTLPQLEASTSSQRLSKWILQNVSLEDHPTLPILLSLSYNKLNIAEQIGDSYLTFGILLLEDKTGAIMTALENEHLKNAERINMAILQKWLQGRGMPVTWLALVTTLEKIGM